MPPQYIPGFPPPVPRHLSASFSVPEPALVPAYSPASPIPQPLNPSSPFRCPQHALKNTVTCAIEKLPVVRPITFRPEKIITSTDRSGNVQALLGYERGSEVATPCEKCRTGRGVFSKCVVLEGYFGGSCTNCRVNDQTNRCSFHVADVEFSGCVKKKVTPAKKPQSPKTQKKRAEGETNSDFSKPTKPITFSSRPSTAYVGTSRSANQKLEDKKKIVVQQKRAPPSKSLLAQAIERADEDKLWSVILELCQNIPNATDIVTKNLARTLSTDTIFVDSRGPSNKSQRLYTAPQLERLLKETIPLPKKAERDSGQKRKSTDDDRAGMPTSYKRRVVPGEEDTEAPVCEACGKQWG